jgi:hypothetical protein
MRDLRNRCLKSKDIGDTTLELLPNVVNVAAALAVQYPENQRKYGYLRPERIGPSVVTNQSPIQ